MTSLENRKKQYRAIFELLDRNPRIYVKTIASELGINPNTASRRIREAFEKGHIVGPQVRKRSYKNFKEYMYFFHCKNPRKQYLEYRHDENIVYHAALIGFPTLWVVSKEKLEPKAEAIIEGPRSDYYLSFPPNHSWELCIEKMKKKVETFNPEEYEPQGIIKSRWNEAIEWDRQDEILFREFKLGIRKKLSSVMKNQHISAEKIYEWFERLPRCCDTITHYFPETISSYDPYLFFFETDYEDFIIDVFSEIPTSCFFFKVSDELILYVFLRKEFLRYVGVTINNFSKLHINLLIMDLFERGILTSEHHALVEYSHIKTL
jgi:DNA-binding Lrp family transcriptional regulator